MYDYDILILYAFNYGIEKSSASTPSSLIGYHDSVRCFCTLLVFCLCIWRRAQATPRLQLITVKFSSIAFIVIGFVYICFGRPLKYYFKRM